MTTSPSETRETNVLLPNAGVAVFSNDSATRDIISGLNEDWRYARVEINAYEGDIEKAIEMYGEYASPNLVIVQTDTLDDSFTERLDSLAKNCEQGTAAIVIGPVNDVYLYRKLIGMGISDYLVKPLEKDVISEVIARSLIAQLGAPGSRLIAVTGAKGGVGASTLSELLTFGLARKYGMQTLLMDAAGGWSTNAVSMGTEPSTTLTEVMRAVESGNADNLKRMIFHPEDKVSVLSSGGDAMLDESITGEDAEAMIDALMVTHPVIIFDLSGASAPVSRAVLSRAHRTLVISTPKPTALRLARTLLHELKDLRGKSESHGIEFILNGLGNDSAYEVSAKDVEVMLEREVSCVLPWNAKAFAADNIAHAFDDKAAGSKINDFVALIAKSLPGGNEKASKDTAKSSATGLLAKLKGGK